MLAVKTGMAKEVLTGESGAWKQVAEFPFDSTVKRMSVVCTRKGEAEMQVLVKGAFESVFPLCNAMRLGESGEVAPLAASGPLSTAAVQQQVDAMANRGLRVLVLAARPLAQGTELGQKLLGGGNGVEREDVEKDLVFVGLVGIMDPPRPEVRWWVGGCMCVKQPQPHKDANVYVFTWLIPPFPSPPFNFQQTLPAVEQCRAANITVRMVTGDHKGTAEAISNQVAILTPADAQVRGRRL